MDKNEILEKSKYSKTVDEGMIHNENRARATGVICMMMLIAAIIVFNLFKGLPSESLQSILWTYIGIEAFTKYRFTKNKIHLFTAVAGILAGVVFLITYITNVW